ncbi:MAG: DUF255 domain-containing protein [Bacteroidota bacterium]|nr:DUF255 domain-containing protein [Bacteroidota bacterium]
MRKIFLIFFAAVSVSLSAQNEGIQFLGDSTLQSALVKAKQANKLLFVDCYTSWCGPCKYMAKNIFPMPEVGNFFNQHFLNWKVDCEKINKVDAGQFAKYNIRAWPTYLFLDRDGNIVHMALGAGPASFFLETGKAALDSTKNLIGLQKRINHGDRSQETLKNYYSCNINADTKYIDEHFSLVEDSVRFSKPSWELFSYFMMNIDGFAFNFFVKNKTQYEKKFGQEAVDSKLTSLFGYYARPGKESQYEKLSKLDTALFAKAKLINEFRKAQMSYSADKTNKEAWNKLINMTSTLFTAHKFTVWELNDVSWMVYENYKKFKDTNALKLAQMWSKKTVDNKPDTHAFNDTYAHILFDLGNKKEAIQKEELALKQATQENAPDQIKFYSDELKRFRGNK